MLHLTVLTNPGLESVGSGSIFASHPFDTRTERNPAPFQGRGILYHRTLATCQTCHSPETMSLPVLMLMPGIYCTRYRPSGTLIPDPLRPFQKTSDEGSAISAHISLPARSKIRTSTGLPDCIRRCIYRPINKRHKTCTDTEYILCSIILQRWCGICQVDTRRDTGSRHDQAYFHQKNDLCE